MALIRYGSGDRLHPVTPGWPSEHMSAMTDFITYCETVEYTIALPRADQDAAMYGEDRRDVKVISREEIARRNEPDYTWECDLKAELYFLHKNGEQIFSSRSHDAVLDHAATLGDDISGARRFGDLENQDKSWLIINANKATD